MTFESSSLPPGWALSTVEELGDPSPQVVTTGPFGTSMGRGDFVSHGVPVLTIGCLTQSGLDMSKAMHVSPEKAASLGRYRLKKGDLLFSRMASVGRMGTITAGEEGALFNYHIMRLRLREAAYESGLFVAYVRGARMVTDYLREVNHGATRDGINTEQLLALPVPVPPRQEQTRILGVLDEHFSRLDAAVASLGRVTVNLKRYRASVLKAAVEGRLVPTEAELAKKESRQYEAASALLTRILKERRRRWEMAELAKMKAKGDSPSSDKWKERYEEPLAPDATNLPALPGGWCWSSVDQLDSGDRKCSYGVLVPGPDVEDGVPLVRVGDLEDGRIERNGLKRISKSIADAFAKTYLRGGEVLLSLVGTIGRTAVVQESLAGANVARAIGVLPVTALVSPYWVEIWFRSPAVRAVTIGKAHEVARKTLNLEDVRAAPVALPPLDEQRRIQAAVDAAESVATKVEVTVALQANRMSRMRQAVLKWAFEGKLLDQDQTDEHASLLLDRIRRERGAVVTKRERPDRARTGRTA